MRYTPQTEAQIQSMNVMDEGIYAFQVMDVTTIDKHGNQMRDKNGNDMAKLKLLLWDNDNRERIIFTYVSGDTNFAYKLRHFAQSIGMVDDYENGTFDILKTDGKSGRANIVIKKGTIKADGSGEMWPDRNDVKDFIIDGGVTVPPHGSYTAPAPQIAAPPQVPNDAMLDDDIPFDLPPSA